MFYQYHLREKHQLLGGFDINGHDDQLGVNNLILQNSILRNRLI